VNFWGKPDYCHSGKLALTKNDILRCAEKWCQMWSNVVKWCQMWTLLSVQEEISHSL